MVYIPSEWLETELLCTNLITEARMVRIRKKDTEPKRRHRTGATLSFYRDESGSVVVIVAILMVALLGFAALAIDTGHLSVVRNELQNASDAAALNGANNFYSKTPSGFSSPIPDPNWAAAELAASANAPANKSSSTLLTDYEVESGYWDLDDKDAENKPLQSKTITPGVSDVPAVRVTVRRAEGSNGGPVQNFFAQVIGTPTSSVESIATAICASPGTVKKGALLPVAIPKWIADKADDYNSPTKIVTIGSSYHYTDDPYNDAVAGQWTSLTEDPINNAKHMKDLIEDGNPYPLSVGDPIYIEPGTMAVGFHDDYIGLYVGKDVVFPVVDAVLRDAVKQVPAPPIHAFIGFHITKLIKNKGFEGYFVKDMYVGASGSIGPYYGAYSPPRLVQ